jgi:hypothetical protein
MYTYENEIENLRRASTHTSGYTVPHSWGSRGRGFESCQPDHETAWEGPDETVATGHPAWIGMALEASQVPLRGKGRVTSRRRDFGSVEGVESTSNGVLGDVRVSWMRDRVW